MHKYAHKPYQKYQIILLLLFKLLGYEVKYLLKSDINLIANTVLPSELLEVVPYSLTHCYLITGCLLIIFAFIIWGVVWFYWAYFLSIYFVNLLFFLNLILRVRWLFGNSYIFSFFYLIFTQIIIIFYRLFETLSVFYLKFMI